MGKCLYFFDDFYPFFRYVVLIPEEAEDMWHMYNLIRIGDVAKSSTIRKAQFFGQVDHYVILGSF